MKKIFSILIALCLALAIHAQSTDKQVATLQYGDQTRVFYGIDALKQAYDAAPDTLGVITLSSGGFRGPNNIEKSITIYGTGFEDDTITGIPKTSVIETYNIYASGVHIEGIYFDSGFGNLTNKPTSLTIGLAGSNSEAKKAEPIHNLSIVKCSLTNIWFRVDCYDCVIRQSHLNNFIGSIRTRPYPSLGPQVFMHNLLVSNNYIRGIRTSEINNSLNNATRSFYDFDPTSTIYVDHCILLSDMMSGDWHYTNNIIKDFHVNGKCNIFLGDDLPVFDKDNNWLNVSPEYVWAEEGEDGEYAENKSFAIKTPELYRATDGTEIGLHGGVYAWNKIPSTPRITECIIDTKDAANGTLKLSIKAEAQTKE
ncbi:MAG: hypothetical protein J1F13_00600 [Prevotellaceae bacterium]|nr:hypothetical protein [Prevotellaceae bacterium]